MYYLLESNAKIQYTLDLRKKLTPCTWMEKQNKNKHKKKNYKKKNKYPE